MPDGRPPPGEPTYLELQVRIQKWLRSIWKQWEAAGHKKVDLAKQLGLTKGTVGNIVNGKELPGLECFMRMHWRLQLDAYRMLHVDPEEARAMHALPPGTPAVAPSKRASRK